MKRLEIGGRILYRERRSGWSLIWFFTSLLPIRLAYTLYEEGLHSEAHFWAGSGAAFLILAGFFLYRCTVLLDPKKKMVQVIVVRYFHRRVRRLACADIAAVELITLRRPVPRMTYLYRILLLTRKGEKVTILESGGGNSPELARLLAEDLEVDLKESLGTARGYL